MPGEAADAALPKAFVSLAGRSLLARSLDALGRVPALELLVPVLPPEAMGRWPQVAAELADAKGVAPPVGGGAERHDSVRQGLCALPPQVTHVAVHDAARPLVRPIDVERVVAAALAGGAAILAVPVRDTLKRADASGRIRETPSREGLWAAQTPQVFRVDWLREALSKAAADGVGGTDDAELVARLGLPVQVVEGDPTNFKITTHADLHLAEAWLRRAGEAP